jgi:PAS domain S-box-containing protein
VVLIAIELLDKTLFKIPNPAPIYLIAVVYAAFTGGLPSGLVSAGITLLYAVYYFSTPGQLFHYSDDNLRNVIILAVTTPAIAIMVGILKQRVERLACEQVTRKSDEANPQSFRDFVQSLNAIVWERDSATSRFIFVSQQAEAILGYPVDQWLSEPNFLANHLHPDDRERIEQQYRECILEAKSQEIEFRAIAADGHPVWLQDNVSVVKDAEGRLTKITGLMVDMSDAYRQAGQRQQAEEQLKRYQVLSEHSRDIVLFVRLDGQIIEANNAAIQAYGYDRSELLSVKIDTLRAPQTHALIAEQIEQADKQGILFETIHRRKDGSFFPVEVSAQSTVIGNEKIVLSIIRDITERKRAEEALRESNRRITNILESITDAFVALDHQWRITYVNQETARLNGQKPEDMIGKTHWEQWPWSVGTVVEREYRRAVTERVAVHLEVLYEPLNLWLEIHAYPSQDGLSIYFRDITERKQIEQSLQVNRDRLDLVLQASQLGLWYCDLPFDKLVWNDKCKEHFGLTPDTEVTIDLFYAQLHPDDRERTRTAIDQSIEQKSGYDIDYRTVAPDGQVRWIRAIGRGFYDATGNPMHFDGITVDISDRKRQEEERSRVEARERQYMRRLQRLAEASVAINSTLSLDEILKLITEQAREIIEAHQSVTSMSVDDNWAQAINAVSLSDKYAQWRQYDEKTDGSGIYTLVCRMQRPMRMTQAELEAHPAWRGFGKHASNHPPMRGWLAVPLTTRDGKNIGLIQLSDKYEGEFTQEDEAILVQLAQMASATIDNARLYQESQQANRLKDDFLATLSHELRSPLNAMLGWLTLLRTRKFDEAAKTRALETIERNARTQAQLVEDILDVSRIIRGQLRLNVRPVALVPVIESALDTVRPAADAKSIRLQSVLDPAAGPVSGDSDRLQQIIWNLLTNAVKFTPKGGRVQICLERINSHVEITVTDTGQGISAEFLPYVFDRFRQADGSITRSYNGLGLGLAIVRHLVELHGGTVHAESPGKGLGARFTVKLPLMAVTTKDSEHERVHPTVGGRVSFENSPSLEGLRILVVDDEADARELLIQILKESGVEVVAVATAEEAIRVLTEQASRLDVLVSDIGMPTAYIAPLFLSCRRDVCCCAPC